MLDYINSLEREGLIKLIKKHKGLSIYQISIVHI